MKYIKSIIKILLAASVVFIFFSCQSVQQKKGQELTISRRLLGEPVLNAQQLADYFVSVRTDADRQQIVQFAQYYIEEAAKENTGSDLDCRGAPFVVYTIDINCEKLSL